MANGNLSPTDLTCDHCGKTADKMRRFFISKGIGANGRALSARICNECVALYMEQLALTDRTWFDERVETARNLKPGGAA